ncbi:MAG: peptide chain release factor 1 [Mycobacteriales bacterium]
MVDPLATLLAEHAELERRLADPSVHYDARVARDLGRRYAELAPVVAGAAELREVEGDLRTARELALEDSSFSAEVVLLEGRREKLLDALRAALVPRDPLDAKNVILEIKAGEGGQESALFAGDLLRMYLRYAERQGWRTEVLGATESDLGGFKDVSVAVAARGGGVWSLLKFEGGVHRVQRVPVTESQGRLHTSAAGVLIYPEAEEVEVSIDPSDLRIDVYRSTGPGGQSVNTTDSAVRITHLPTGTVVTCQNEKSQLQNKESALRILRARLLAAAEQQAAAQAAAARVAQVRTVDRSERIRTYNFKENRVSDHRIGYTAYNLDQVLDGELDALVGALGEADRTARLAGEPGLA